MKDFNEKEKIKLLIEDILGCFPDKVEEHLIKMLNSHKVSKDLTIQILKIEIKKKKSRYRILAGSLILVNWQLIEWHRNFYTAVEILPELKWCLHQNYWKTIKGWSSEIILRTFLSLHHEFVILPLPSSDINNYLDKFRKTISQEDIKEAVELLGIFKKGGLLTGRIIFEHHGIKFDIINPEKTRKEFNRILNNFYAKHHWKKPNKKSNPLSLKLRKDKRIN